MRLFIAVEMPEKIRENISSLQILLDSEQDKIKWVEKENIHLTMKFLGEAEERKLDSVIKELAKIRFPSFWISVFSSGAFPTKGKSRVIWLGLSPEEEIISLHKKIDSAMIKAGFEKDKRFSPHVTIGRVRHIENHERFLGLLKKKVSLMKKEPFPVNEFVLKKSTLTPQGPIYEDIARFNAFQ